MGFGEVLHGGTTDTAEVERVRDVLIFDGPDVRQRLIRFGALLILASAIATFGLLANSVATVIGAMIVAPLMIPIMGTAFGISIGERRAIWTSLAVLSGGVLTAVLVGTVLSIPFQALDPTTIDQVMIRTDPRLVDLLAALATGLAGAFAMSRKDVSDTLPGVAIAISLVPPLTNAGILFGAGESGLAWGSVLLFVTNLLAIILMGTFTFTVMGFSRAAIRTLSDKARRTAIAVVVALTVVILVPLGTSSYQVIATSVVQARVTSAVNDWLDGSEFRLVSTDTVDGGVRIVLTGPGEMPDTAALEATLAEQLDGRSLIIEAVPQERLLIPGR
ncbi:MAG TPA: DUF389 domain-containing protein [Propionibacteriaceae bacterium]|nr:DUF389 domain-containing protein [Propionibacteriaceae bacterium]